MFISFTPTDHHAGMGAGGVAGTLDALIAFEEIGMRRTFARNEEIFGEGDRADGWYKVISGTVRMCRLLADGRRHIAEFYFSGDCFGYDNRSERLLSAEAVGDVIVMRYPRAATERLINNNTTLFRSLNDMTLRDLAKAQFRMLLLGRMNAAEKVASFLLDMFERRYATRALHLTMSRNDIADYLGLKLETVCRVMSMFKREGLIRLPTPQHIELRDRDALEAIGRA